MNLLYKTTIIAATLVALQVTAPTHTPTTHVYAVSASSTTAATTFDDLPWHHIAPRVITPQKPKPRPHRASRSRFTPVKTAPSHTCGSNWRGTLSYAEAWIIERESGFSTTNPNPHSTAFGLGQLLDYNRATYGRKLGVSPSTTDPCAQIAMFRMYVADRYGNAENAMAFWRVHSWY